MNSRILQRRKSYPLDNAKRAELLQQYRNNENICLQCRSRKYDDSSNELSYLNENYRNKTRTWKCHDPIEESINQRNNVKSKLFVNEKCENVKNNKQVINDSFSKIHDKEYFNVVDTDFNCITNNRKVNNKRSGLLCKTKEIFNTNDLGVVGDVACYDLTDCTTYDGYVTNNPIITAGNGRFRRRRRGATASTIRAARRLRRERRARCFARTTIATTSSRRGVVPDYRKKVCYSVITVLSSFVVSHRGCRTKFIKKRKKTTVTLKKQRRNIKIIKSGTPIVLSRITTFVYIQTGKKIVSRRIIKFIVNNKNNSENKNNKNNSKNDFISKNKRKFSKSKNSYNTSNESSGKNSSIFIANVRLRRKRCSDKEKCEKYAYKGDESTERFVDDNTKRFDKRFVNKIKKLFGVKRKVEQTYNETLDAEMKSKDSDTRINAKDDTNDPNEDTERYDEFNAVMVPVSRILSKSPQSDEGIETDTERRKNTVTKCWSLDSSNIADEDSTKGGKRDKKKSKPRITRCCSSDSAVLSDEDQVKGWENLILCDGTECESTEGTPRYWRTPSVVVSDYSDYSYLEEKYERSDPELEKYEGGVSGSPSQSSSCSCLDCDEISDFQDLSRSLDSHLLQVCGRRRHSDSCCACITSNRAISNGGNDASNRRNSCLASPSSYRYCNKTESGNADYANKSSIENRNQQQEQLPSNVVKSTIELLEIPPPRKISDCSTNSSLSGDDYEVTELQPFQRPQSSGWRKLRNIVQWTPFFQTYKKQRYPWVQLAGHQGNFRAGPTPGTILKKLCPQEEACFRLLMRDVLRPYVPEFKGVLDIRESEEDRNHHDAESTGVKETDEDSQKGAIVASYLQLQDLLGDFEQPCVMDCKVGVRTYLESELAKAKERPKLRKDMYEKMIQVDPSAPNSEERRVQGVTKPRYMVWRETISSTATLGFRVEGIKLGHGGSSKDFKTTRTREQVTEALKRFVENYPHAVPKYLQRLKAIRATLKASPFFASHEVVGSSLLFVHDAKNAGVWMIDFAKTLPLPSHLPNIHHDAEWQVGNHEDGYLIGVNNLIDIFQDIRNSET